MRPYVTRHNVLWISVLTVLLVWKLKSSQFLSEDTSAFAIPVTSENPRSRTGDSPSSSHLTSRQPTAVEESGTGDRGQTFTTASQKSTARNKRDTASVSSARWELMCMCVFRIHQSRPCYLEFNTGLLISPVVCWQGGNPRKSKVYSLRASMKHLAIRI